MNDHEAYGVRHGGVTSVKLSQVGGRFIELWKRQHFPYLQVEETYLVRKEEDCLIFVSFIDGFSLCCCSGEQATSRRP